MSFFRRHVAYAKLQLRQLLIGLPSCTELHAQWQLDIRGLVPRQRCQRVAYQHSKYGASSAQPAILRGVTGTC
ncbi:hypothetical protein B0H19DRAFT_1161423, partial [Mycena capillaripes]